MYLSETYQKKWQLVLDHPDLPKISDSRIKRACYKCYLGKTKKTHLKKTERFLKEDAPTNANWFKH